MALEIDIKYFAANYHTKFYRGKVVRLWLCLSTIATLLNMTFRCYGRVARPGCSGNSRWSERLGI